MMFSPEREAEAGSDLVIVEHEVKEEEKPDVFLQGEVKHEYGEGFKIEDTKLDVSKLKVKKKFEDQKFSADSVEARLNLVGKDPLPILLSRAIQDVIVPRAYITSKCRGNLQRTFTRGYPERVKDLYKTPQKTEDEVQDSETIGEEDGGGNTKVIKKEKNEDEDDDSELFAYMNPDFQTMAPRLPGHPGLFFSTELSHGSGRGVKVYYLFTRITPQPALWQYMGRYEMRPCPSLTADEWNRLTPKVKTTWATKINQMEWGKMVRVRIRTRALLGREPTEDELEQNVDNNGPFGSPDTVIAAYNNGEETLAVWTLKCIGYDDEFQEAIAKGYTAGDTANGKRGTNAKKAATTKTENDEADLKGSKLKSAKRKYAGASNDMKDPDSDYGSASPAKKRTHKVPRRFDTESYDKELPLTSKGTRSRPRAPRAAED